MSNADEEKCGECDEPLLPHELKCRYEGEMCHIDCAAKAMDEADFDGWFDGR